jgi:hypothetical protein
LDAEKTNSAKTQKRNAEYSLDIVGGARKGDNKIVFIHIADPEKQIYARKRNGAQGEADGPINEQSPLRLVVATVLYRILADLASK